MGVENPPKSSSYMYVLTYVFWNELLPVLGIPKNQLIPKSVLTYVRGLGIHQFALAGDLQEPGHFN